MRALLQRTTGARVRVDGAVIGEIGMGLVVFLGVGPDDYVATAEALARRITELRLFRDEDGRTNLSLLDVGGEVLLISQFTLYGDCRKGNRPSFTEAAPADQAEQLYQRLAARLRAAQPLGPWPLGIVRCDVTSAGRPVANRQRRTSSPRSCR